MNDQLFYLKGKTALVTGGASGIGQSISRLFAARGAEVMILDTNAVTAAEEVEYIRAEQGQASYAVCDVSRQDEVRKAFSKLLGERPLDILINNAGIAHIGNIEQTSEEDLDRLYNINVKGVFHCLKESIVRMKDRGGAIVNLASIASLVGIPDRFAYSMSKGAVLTMTYSIAQDYISQNIRCNCIAPARIHTPFVDGFISKNYPGKEEEMFKKLSNTQPIGRMGSPEEVAYLALFLVSDQAAFITGTCYPLDGGFITLNN